MRNDLQPPRQATLLLSLFAGESDFPQIEGDLREEFHQILSESGPEQATEWYRREAWRNVWAFLKRPRIIHVLGSAALSVAIFRLVCPACFQWLRVVLRSAPRLPGLRLVLMTLFEIATAFILGAVVSRVWTGHESLVRRTFTLFYILTAARFILFSGIHDVWLSEPLRFLMDQFGLACVITCFWIGSFLVEGPTHRPDAMRKNM